MFYLNHFEILIFLRVDKSEIAVPFIYDIDPNDQGSFIFNQTIRDRSIFGDEDRDIKVRMSTIYTDYENIAVFYQCWNERNNLIVNKVDEVYILSKTRKFDSLTVFARALGSLQNLDIDFNRLKFVYNGPNCPN